MLLGLTLYTKIIYTLHLIYDQNGSLMSQFKSSQSQSQLMMNGFTLVELVIVIVLIGVLSVTAIPKLIGKSAFEDSVVRDQLISQLRLVQLQGMSADPAINTQQNACYWLVVKDGCFYHEHTVKSGNHCKLPSTTNVCKNDDYNQYGVFSFTKGLVTPALYRFKINSGILSEDSSASPIIIKGKNNLMITVESQGYIHD